MSILTVANDRLFGSVKQDTRRESKLFSEIAKSKPSEFSEDRSGRFNLSHEHRTLALDL